MRVSAPADLLVSGYPGNALQRDGDAGADTLVTQRREDCHGMARPAPAAGIHPLSGVKQAGFTTGLSRWCTGKAGNLIMVSSAPNLGDDVAVAAPCPAAQ